MPYDAGTTVIINECWPNGKTKHKKWDDGEEHFYNDKGYAHREDGPAVIFCDGEIQYWLNGTYLKDVTCVEELIIKLLLE